MATRSKDTTLIFSAPLQPFQDVGLQPAADQIENLAVADLLLNPRHQPIMRGGANLAPRHEDHIWCNPVLFVRRHVSPVAPRREHIERDQAEDRGGQAEKRQDGHAAARPVLDLGRIARAQNQIERIGAEGAQRDGSSSANAMTMAAFREVQWSGRRSRSCWTTSGPARSIQGRAALAILCVACGADGAQARRRIDRPRPRLRDRKPDYARGRDASGGSGSNRDRRPSHQPLHDAFVQGFAARATAIRLGDGLDPAVGMGPLINASRLTEIEGIVAEAVRAGAKVVAGGGRASAFNAGHF